MSPAIPIRPPATGGGAARDRPARGPLRLLWSGAFAFFFSFYLLLPTLPLYARQAGASDPAIGFIVGSFALASMVVKPWAGWASDRFGRKPVLLAGLAIFVVASLWYGVATGTLTLVLVRLVHGCGMGLFPTAASTAVTDVAPPGRRGEYLGFFGAAGNTAMAFGPIAGMAVVGYAGFGALFLVGAVTASAGLLISTTVPETLSRPRRLPFRLGATLSRAALAPAGIVLLLTITYGVQVAFLPLFAHEQHMNPALFFVVFALMMATVRGRAGRLSDRLGRPPVAVTGLLLVASALVTQVIARTALGLIAAGMLYGVGFGSAQSALMAWCVDRAGPHDRGRAMGAYYTAFELGGGMGAILAGVAVDRVGFAVTFLIVVATTVAGALLAIVAGRTLASTPEEQALVLRNG